jgi:hypothetical protein
MKIFIFLICFMLIFSSAWGVVYDNNAEKTILLLVDSENIGKHLGIENVFISNQKDQPLLIAFYGEDEKHIFVFNAGKKKLTRFQLKVPGSLMETSSVSFVTICWDQLEYGKFAVIFSRFGHKLVFMGDIQGDVKEALLRDPLKIKAESTGFNYRSGILSFVNLGNGKIETIHGKSPGSFPGTTKQELMIIDFKLVQNTGEPYYTLRNPADNEIGIYKGKEFDRAVDSPGIAELYPHYSPAGTLLGYIEFDKEKASASVCLKISDKKTIKSTFTFALEENALLREYYRMYFLEETLYFFLKVPDLDSKDKKPGLFMLSENGEKMLHYKEPLISKNDRFIDILNRSAACLEVRKVPIVKDIIPISFENHIYLVILTYPGNYKLKVELPGGNSYYPSIRSQAIVLTKVSIK